MDFLFHKVSEEEKEDIKKQAKSIMENFSEKLSKVDDKIPEPHVERDEFEREEESVFPPTQPKEKDEDFRERIFENAPSKNKDFILAEKKGW
jgi:Asp-tRNA(Asn)/Glu-tRNA(Gln) amidotransferase C subunit